MIRRLPRPALAFSTALSQFPPSMLTSVPVLPAPVTLMALAADMLPPVLLIDKCAPAPTRLKLPALDMVPWFVMEFAATRVRSSAGTAL